VETLKKEKKVYFQVTYLISSEDVYKREFWNLKKINDNFEKIVLSMDEIIFNDKDWIKHINIMDLESII